MNSQAKKEDRPVVFLLALWGESYIKNFFDFSLRSLLAPGNIPAMSEEYECTFLFLTRDSDVDFFKSQTCYQQLDSHCRIKFIDISDLIFEGSYSATLTLAYERGMRSRGDKICETYFFFLVSDYIMANGSLHNLKKYLKEGYSGITAGNFLVIEESVAPLLEKKIAADPKGILSLEPREMLALGFPYMHPVSQAHTVTHGLTHALHANRLFWRVNDQVMVGRFYLRHMLCIKPEIDHYQIGAACDYSFIPEMCPSGNIAHIQDSDIYCLIEMAPYDYEQSMIATGPYEIPALAVHLSKWTTSVHRANAHIPVIYHSVPLKESPMAILQESATYIQQIESHLSIAPQSIRQHPYWKACVEDILYQIFILQKFERFSRSGTIAGILGSPTFSHILGNAADDRLILNISKKYSSLKDKKRTKANLQRKIVGQSPGSYFWHLHWFEDFLIRRDIKRHMKKFEKCAVIAFETIPNLYQWLEKEFPNRCSYYFYAFLMKKDSNELEKILQNQKYLLVWQTDGLFRQLAALLRRCGNVLQAGSHISVYLKHRKAYPKEYVQQMAAICAAELKNFQINCESIKHYFSIPRRKLTGAYKKNIKKAFGQRKPFSTRVSGYFGLTLLASISSIWNILSWLRLGAKKKATGATIVFRTKG